MAFKKAKKAKKAKKSAKTSRDRTWDNDGGVVYDRDEAQDNDETPGVRKRRETQDRDERMRRGKAKIEYRKKETERKKKWSKKICFADILAGRTGDEVEEKIPKFTKIKRDPYKRSSKSVSERLQFLFKAGDPTSEAELDTQVRTEIPRKRDDGTKDGREMRVRLVDAEAAGTDDEEQDGDAVSDRDVDETEAVEEGDT